LPTQSRNGIGWANPAARITKVAQENGRVESDAAVAEIRRCGAINRR
jgi:hypothetical protein